MRILLSVIDSETGLATGTEMAAITAFNHELRRNGQLLLAEGLEPPRQARVIDNRSGQASITPGPLVSSADYLSGFWVLDVADIEEAERLALAASKACNRRVELRAALT